MQTFLNKTIGAKLSWLLLTVGLGFACNQVAFAEDNYINDQANVVSPAMKGKLDKLLSELETKKNLLIEEHIVPTLGNDDPLKIINELSDKLDARNSKAENRALILYVLDNGFVHIYPNKPLATIISKENIASIVQNATKKLQDKNYDEMARIGIAGIYHYYQNSATDKTSDKSSTGKKTLLNMLLVLVLLVVVIGIVKMSNKKSL